MWRPRRLAGTQQALERAYIIELLTSCALVTLGFISYKQLATPACDGLPHSVPVDSSVLAAYPCHGSLLRTQLYILLNTRGVFWDICRLKHEDAWVTLSFLGLLLRLLAFLVLPSRLYNKVLVPVLVYFLRAVTPTFHILMGPTFRPSPLALRSLFGTFTAFDIGYFFSMLGLWRVNPTLELIYCAWSTLSLMLLCRWYGNLVPGGVRPAWQLGARLGVAAVTLGAERALRRWRRGGAAAAAAAAVTKVGRVMKNGKGEGEAGATEGIKADGGGEGSLRDAVNFAARSHRATPRRDGCLPYVRWQPEDLSAEVRPYGGLYGSRPGRGAPVGGADETAALPAEVMAALGGAAAGPAGRTAAVVAAHPVTEPTPVVREARAPATTAMTEAAAATRGSTEVPRTAPLDCGEDAEGAATILGGGFNAPGPTGGCDVGGAAPVAAAAVTVTGPAQAETTNAGTAPVRLPAAAAAAAAPAAAAVDAAPTLPERPPSHRGDEVYPVAAGHAAANSVVRDAPPARGPAALPPYRSMVKRRTVVVKIPWAEPEQLPANFLERLSVMIAERSRPVRRSQSQVADGEELAQPWGGGWRLAHAYVRRGCIELMLGLEAVDRPESEWAAVIGPQDPSLDIDAAALLRALGLVTVVRPGGDGDGVDSAAGEQGAGAAMASDPSSLAVLVSQVQVHVLDLLGGDEEDGGEEERESEAGPAPQLLHSPPRVLHAWPRVLLLPPSPSPIAPSQSQSELQSQSQSQSELQSQSQSQSHTPSPGSHELPPAAPPQPPGQAPELPTCGLAGTRSPPPVLLHAEVDWGSEGINPIRSNRRRSIDSSSCGAAVGSDGLGRGRAGGCDVAVAVSDGGAMEGGASPGLARLPEVLGPVEAEVEVVVRACNICLPARVLARSVQAGGGLSYMYDIELMRLPPRPGLFLLELCRGASYAGPAAVGCGYGAQAGVVRRRRVIIPFLFTDDTAVEADLAPAVAPWPSARRLELDAMLYDMGSWMAAVAAAAAGTAAVAVAAADGGPEGLGPATRVSGGGGDVGGEDRDAVLYHMGLHLLQFARAAGWSGVVHRVAADMRRLRLAAAGTIAAATAIARAGAAPPSAAAPPGADPASTDPASTDPAAAVAIVTTAGTASAGCFAGAEADVVDECIARSRSGSGGGSAAKASSDGDDMGDNLPSAAATLVVAAQPQPQRRTLARALPGRRPRRPTVPSIADVIACRTAVEIKAKVAGKIVQVVEAALRLLLLLWGAHAEQPLVSIPTAASVAHGIGMASLLPYSTWAHIGMHLGLMRYEWLRCWPAAPGGGGGGGGGSASSSRRALERGRGGAAAADAGA